MGLKEVTFTVTQQKISQPAAFWSAQQTFPSRRPVSNCVCIDPIVAPEMSQVLC